MSKARTGERVILRMRRVINAPREAVFDAFTNPNLIPQWWYLPGCAVGVDLKAGGDSRWSKKNADGTSNGVFGKYIEVDRPRKLVFTFNWEGDEGQGTVATVEFADMNGKTEILLTHDITENANACEDGWGGCLDRMAELLAATTEGRS